MTGRGDSSEARKLSARRQRSHLPLGIDLEHGEGDPDLALDPLDQPPFLPVRVFRAA